MLAVTSRPVAPSPAVRSRSNATPALAWAIFKLSAPRSAFREEIRSAMCVYNVVAFEPSGPYDLYALSCHISNDRTAVALDTSPACVAVQVLASPVVAQQEVVLSIALLHQ